MNSALKINREWGFALGGSALLGALGLFNQNFVLSTWLMVILSGGLAVYCLLSLKERLALLLFDGTMFLFLIARPALDVFSNFAVYNSARYDFNNGLVANRMILLALLGLFLGQFLYEKKLWQREERLTGRIFSQELLRYIRLVAFLGFLMGSGALLLENAEKIIFRQTHSYEALYSEFQTGLPFVVLGFAEVSLAFLVFFLASSRSLKYSLGAIAIYVATSGTLLLAGVRADFSRALLFALFMAVTILKKKVTLSKKITFRIMAGALLLGILLLPLLYRIGFSRWQDNARELKFQNPIIDFIYGQSVSYQTVAVGQEMIKLPPFSDKHYAFGPFLDQYVNDLPDNPYTMAYIEHGDSMAADLGYFLLGGSQYLKGKGMGSSYLIEMYADFGHLGVFLFSLFLGALLASLSHLGWRNILVDAVKIRILMDIFYIPRAPATRFLVNLLAPKFILPILGTILAAYILLLIQRRRKPL